MSRFSQEYISITRASISRWLVMKIVVNFEGNKFWDPVSAVLLHVQNTELTACIYFFRLGKVLKENLVTVAHSLCCWIRIIRFLVSVTMVGLLSFSFMSGCYLQMRSHV